jgi:hypothetical protein
MRDGPPRPGLSAVVGLLHTTKLDLPHPVPQLPLSSTNGLSLASCYEADGHGVALLAAERETLL